MLISNITRLRQLVLATQEETYVIYLKVSHNHYQTHFELLIFILARFLARSELRTHKIKLITLNIDRFDVYHIFANYSSIYTKIMYKMQFGFFYLNIWCCQMQCTAKE
jgi:hypothetical protein